MKIEFDTDSKAFDEYSGEEVVRILRKIIQEIENGHHEGVIMDLNGHRIGRWIA